VAVITWNLARKDQKIFTQSPETFFKEVDLNRTHLLAITGQESRYKNPTMDAIEKFLLKWGFINVDTTFCSQWEMFLICFVRLDLKPMVSNV